MDNYYTKKETEAFVKEEVKTVIEDNINLDGGVASTSG
jgi:hypothetical protein